MCKLTRIRPFIALVSFLGVVLATGCGSQPTHPNQLNAFDGASYDTLTLAHGALTSLRSHVSVSYPKYAPLFNEAANSYSAAYDSYVVYRTSPSDAAALTVAISNLTISVVALENSIQTDLQVAPSVIQGIRKQALTVRARAAGQNVTVSDILTELEIAAAVARTIPASSVYAGLASVVIDATSQALAAEAANTGQPIDLSTILPMATL